MDNAAQRVPAAHRTGGFVTDLGNGDLLIKALMRACGVEERDIFAHDALQVRLVDDQLLVQAFFPH